MTLGAGGRSKVIFGVDDKYTFLDWVRWKGENRLLVGATYIRIDKDGGEIAFNFAYGRFILAMDVDGKNLDRVAEDHPRGPSVGTPARSSSCSTR